MEQGIQSVIAFLREEHNIQAPSPSTIRPIAESFYKEAEIRGMIHMNSCFIQCQVFMSQVKKKTLFFKTKL
jgi:hypothetical protein